YPTISLVNRYDKWNSRDGKQGIAIPGFGLFDADPYGILPYEMFCTFKYWSIAQAFNARNLVIPDFKWLGVLPSDINRLRHEEIINELMI
ncbi:meiotic recombination protein SPO11-like isoform X6, partial [Leptotrombidium deliense]